MATWVIRRLDKTHDRSGFQSGQPILDDCLKDRAGQFERRDLSRTFGATRPAEPLVLGYYAISTHRVIFDALPEPDAKGLPRLDIPVVLIGRLAVDQSVQNQGLGAFLLIDALRRSLQISEPMGIHSVHADALDDNFRSFPLKFGFRSLRDNARYLLLPMHEIRKLKIDPP